jgi:hypothetical protein
MTSSGQRPGANTTLAIEDIPAERANDDRADVQHPKLVTAAGGAR